MASKTFAPPVSGPVVFDLEAPAASVVITVSPDAEVVSAELSGPAELVDGARSAGTAGRWALTLPRPPATVIGNTGTTVIQSSGGLTVTGGISIAGGQVIVGDSMTFVNGRLTGGTRISTITAEPVRLAVTLPAGSRLAARIDAGRLTVYGLLPEAEVTGTAADVDIAAVGTLRVRTVSGDITAAMVTRSAGLHTVSGDIDIDVTAGPVTARTTSGDITIGTGSDITIDAGSVSGDITVRAARGAVPDVRARSVSGDVRTRRGGAR